MTCPWHNQPNQWALPGGMRIVERAWKPPPSFPKESSRTGSTAIPDTDDQPAANLIHAMGAA